MNENTKPIGIFGGTFDPVHLGHLQIADDLLHEFNLQEMRFIPCKQPILKGYSEATPEQRLEMLKIAVKGHPGLVIDERELHRETKSYTLITLQSLRKEFPENPFWLIIGMDAFWQFPQWYQWRELFNYAHIIVINRFFTHNQENSEIETLLRRNEVHDTQRLFQEKSGLVYQKNLPPLLISSTAIRRAIAAGQDCKTLLPPGVWEYIEDNHLYQNNPL